jgi:prenyl protein peptidase
MLTGGAIDCPRHGSLSLSRAIIYCSTLSLCYVGSLYVLVPPKIRKLHRDDMAQIQWRTMTTLVVCLLASITYPLLFCEDPETLSVFIGPGQKLYFWESLVSATTILCHSISLYFGTIVTLILGVFFETKMKGHLQRSRHWKSQFIWSMNRTDQWIFTRNYFVAPFTEEIIFRGCMVPVLSATKLTNISVTFIAPLFFGFAHVHHAIVKLQQGQNKMHVFFETCFQFLYTSLFGFYASYAYIKKRSLVGVILCHAFCNWMGLPSFEFLNPASNLHRFWKSLVIAHCLGMILFICFLRLIWNGFRYIPLRLNLIWKGRLWAGKEQKWQWSKRYYVQ